jgi:voltage-gated potassium channel
MNKKFEIFVSIVTAISVIVILLPSIFPLTYNQLQTIYILDIIVVIILVADFYMRFKESEEKGIKFIAKHWYEIPAMLPLILFAIVEQDQSFIGATARGLRLIRLFRIVHLFFRTLRIFEGRRILYIIIFSTIALTSGAISEYLVESTSPNAKITNIGDAFWWAIATVTAAGYGDVYPVTVGGKIIASLLMIVGIAILGVLISTLGAELIETRFKEENTRRGKGKLEPSITDETKILIKTKIDGMENLNEEDFDNLMATIKHLRVMLHKC